MLWLLYASFMIFFLFLRLGDSFYSLTCCFFLKIKILKLMKNILVVPMMLKDQEMGKLKVEVLFATYIFSKYCSGWESMKPNYGHTAHPNMRVIAKSGGC